MQSYCIGYGLRVTVAALLVHDDTKASVMRNMTCMTLESFEEVQLLFVIPSDDPTMNCNPRPSDMEVDPIHDTTCHMHAPDLAPREDLPPPALSPRFQGAPLSSLCV